MTILKLAIRNLRGAGIRTWLNAVALSFAFVAIIFGQGMLQGMNKQVEDASTAFEFGGGQYWQNSYDPYDPLTLEDAHAPLPPVLDSLATAGKALPYAAAAVGANEAYRHTLKHSPTAQKVRRAIVAATPGTDAYNQKEYELAARAQGYGG